MSLRCVPQAPHLRLDTPLGRREERRCWETPPGERTGDIPTRVEGVSRLLPTWTKSVYLRVCGAERSAHRNDGYLNPCAHEGVKRVTAGVALQQTKRSGKPGPSTRRRGKRSSSRHSFLEEKRHKPTLELGASRIWRSSA